MLWDIKGENRWTATITNGYNGIGKINLMIEKKQFPKPGTSTETPEMEDKFVLTLHGQNKGMFNTQEEADSAAEKVRDEVKIHLAQELNLAK